MADQYQADDYQALFSSPPQVQFTSSSTLNPDTLPPDPDLDGPLHNYQEILSHLKGTRPDISDLPLKEADITWYTDGSSFIKDGTRYAGVTVAIEEAVV